MVSRGVAQLVARLLWEQEVRGSSPRTPTPTRLIYQPTNSPILTHIASGSNSVVEFLPSKQAVAGSSPVSRSLHPASQFACAFTASKQYWLFSWVVAKSVQRVPAFIF
jgi:hypothetical protein